MGVADILRFAISIIVLTIYLSVLCLFGDEVNSKFDEIHNWIYYCNWLTFPYRIQKLIPTILIAAEKPVYIQGFMNVRCIRESMKKVNFIQS